MSNTLLAFHSAPGLSLVILINDLLFQRTRRIKIQSVLTTPMRDVTLLRASELESLFRKESHQIVKTGFTRSPPYLSAELRVRGCVSIIYLGICNQYVLRTLYVFRKCVTAHPMSL